MESVQSESWDRKQLLKEVTALLNGFVTEFKVEDDAVLLVDIVPPTEPEFENEHDVTPSWFSVLCNLALQSETEMFASKHHSTSRGTDVYIHACSADQYLYALNREVLNAALPHGRAERFVSDLTRQKGSVPADRLRAEVLRRAPGGGAAMLTATQPANLLELGECLVTAGVQALNLPTVWMTGVIARHASHDWGELPEEDVAQQREDLAVGRQRMVMSVFSHLGREIWIITDHAREATTLLLPDEY